MSRASDTAVHWYISTSSNAASTKCTARSGRAAHSPVRLRYIYTGSRSCIALRYPMHMCWVAELCNPAVPYAYLLGREAV